MSSRPSIHLALTESADPRHLAASAAVPSTPALPVWHQTGRVRLGQPGPVESGPTAARFDGGSSVSTIVPGPVEHWTMAATIRPDVHETRTGPQAISGVIVSLDEGLEEGPVRALVIRGGRLGVLSWSWRGGLVCFSAPDRVPAGRWAHVAASFNASGDLMLFIDGQLTRVFRADSLWPGRQGLQKVSIGAPVTFTSEVIPGWRGLLRNVETYSHALEPAQVERLARKALRVAEPAPEPEPAPVGPPAPQACGNPAHFPGWRFDGADGPRCILCNPARGCAFDDHQSHWRPAAGSDVYRGDLDLECGLCLATSARLAEAGV